MRAMPKHSFNADDTTEGVLTTVEKVLKDKTEFLNRLVTTHGEAMIRHIMNERQRALRQMSMESRVSLSKQKKSVA